VIDLDALKAELEQQATNIDGNVMIEVAVVHSIIARHVAPVVTPEPPAEARDVLAEIRFVQQWSDRDYEDPMWFLDREWAQQAAEDDLAALRARGFAVVRTDVEPRTCLGCQHFKRGASSLDHRCTLLVGVMSGDSIGVDESFSCAAWEAIL
jgi:hypothetical protein